MRVKTLVNFFDLKKKVDRKRGEEFVVTDERFAEINAVGQEKIGGPIVERVDEPEPEAEPEPKPKAKKRPTKAELLAEAEALGIDVPEGATNPEIAKLVEAAR